MKTTADRIQEALDSKEDIRQALAEKTGEDPGYVLSEYAPKIRALGGGKVNTVNQVEPDENGNVQLSAADLGISATVKDENLTLTM